MNDDRIVTRLNAIIVLLLAIIVLLLAIVWYLFGSLIPSVLLPFIVMILPAAILVSIWGLARASLALESA